MIARPEVRVLRRQTGIVKIDELQGKFLMNNMSLSQNEIRMLVQSLDHCLATCHNYEKSAGTVCGDCETAKALRQKLSAELAA